MRNDDLAPLMSFTTQLGPAATQGDFGFHQGLVIAWDAATGQNTISIAGAEVHDVPTLTSAGLVALEPGEPVGILRYKSTYFILGRIVGVNSGLVEPQWPIVLYPMFQPKLPTDTGGYYYVSTGKLVTWEGRIKVSHPKIEIDGVWGMATGTGNVTYQLQLDDTAVAGQWSYTGTTLAVERHGPFDVSQFIGRDWLRIELAITASGGTGDKAFQPLGVYFRQT